MIQPALIHRASTCVEALAQIYPSITKRFVQSALLQQQRGITFQPNISSATTAESRTFSYNLRRLQLQNLPTGVRTMTIPVESTKEFHCVHVYIKVVPGMEDAFMEATLHNARASSTEEGVVRFDVYRDQEKSNEFVLVEVYKDSTIAPAQHKETSHYLLWRDTVAPMMAEERSRRLFHNLFPTTTDGWKYPSDTPLE